MTWKTILNRGVVCFKRGDLEEALVHMNEVRSNVPKGVIISYVIEQAAELESNNPVVYSSRAAVHEELGNIKDALVDLKRVIDLAPNRWQSYARSARLFDFLGKHDRAIKMIEHTLSNLRSVDIRRRAPLVELRKKAVAALAVTEKRRPSQVEKLPVETLLEIFTVLINEDHTWAVKLSHICGHWRQILVNTPSAWRTLVLSKKQSLRKAQLWKQRAKNRITHISAVEMSRMDRTSVLAELLDLSWDGVSSLRISAKAFVELHRMLSDISLPHTFSKLDELALVEFAFPEELSCCLSGPNWKLRVLRLSGSIEMKGSWWQRIRQLKELHLEGTMFHFSTRVFTANPLLEKLVLDCGQILLTDLPPGYGYSNNASTTAMNNLKTIECRGVMNPLRALRAITVPSITNFSMQAVMMADHSLLHISSNPSLVELHIADCTLNHCILPGVLSSMRKLEVLRINSVQEVVNHIFDLLSSRTFGLPRTLRCPALKHVDVSRCSDLKTSSAHGFVETRAQFASESVLPADRCAALISLKMDGCPNIEPDMLPWFRSKIAQFSCVYPPQRSHEELDSSL